MPSPVGEGGPLAVDEVANMQQTERPILVSHADTVLPHPSVAEEYFGN